MTRKEIEKEYFEWLFDRVCANRYVKHITFRKLLTHLHNTEFVYFIQNDENRADDGIELRYRFAITQGYEDEYELVLDYLINPCSVLEMLVALSLRCEECIMVDPEYGDRTSQWFWGMITNLGLGSMSDDRFDEDYVIDILDRFLNRDYAPDGEGGLFTVRKIDCDLREVEIWYQLCYFLDSIT